MSEYCRNIGFKPNMCKVDMYIHIFVCLRFMCCLPSSDPNFLKVLICQPRQLVYDLEYSKIYILYAIITITKENIKIEVFFLLSPFFLASQFLFSLLRSNLSVASWSIILKREKASLGSLSLLCNCVDILLL